MAGDMAMIRVLFLVSSLHQGGAERQLVTLLHGLDRKRFRSIVVTYYPGGTWEESLRRLPCVDLHCLGLKNRFDLAGMIMGLSKIIRRTRPDILYGLLGDACTLALIHGKIIGKSRVIWGLRATNVDFSQYSLISGLVYRLNAYLSTRVDRIIINSWAGLKYHADQGYACNRITVIPNGIDTGYFMPQPDKGADLRRQWQINPDIPLIGRVGRLDPMKDYATFLKAAKTVAARRPDVRFVIAGSGPDQILDDLKTLSCSLGLDGRVLWLGPREDLPAVYSACTLTSSSSSFGEGFPNVVAESLACETPCVATDVGDSARVLGPGGIIVPPGSPAALAEAWVRILSLSQEQQQHTGKKGREHVIDSFGIQEMVHATEKVFLSVASYL
jgi:glycosyltransferase involved in cell wall biosynthesis